MSILRPLSHEDLPILWEIAYSHPNSDWKQFDAPYFDDYQHYEKFLDFQQDKAEKFVGNPDRLGIFQNGRLVGTVSRYWECKETRWMELGIDIYQSSDWGQGLGQLAMKEWIGRTFQDYPELERLGLTTWSGNHGMMRLAEKLGLQKEARIRKVRYYQGIYYDSMKYGVLREEWKKANEC